MLEDHQDAYGHEILDYVQLGHSVEIVEREDGWIDISLGAPQYFAPYQCWSPIEKAGMKLVRGRVLDVGCGAGRVMRYLEDSGFEVTGIDSSPLAVKVCRNQGLKGAVGLPITKVSKRLGEFDTIVMYGNNFGLFGSFKRAQWLLRRFHTMTSEQGRIIAATTDPYATNIREHRWYHRFNRRRGRMGGQLRIRIRYRKYVTPYFDYLLASRNEVKQIVRDTGWRVDRFIDSRSAPYLVVLERL